MIMWVGIALVFIAWVLIRSMDNKTSKGKLSKGFKKLRSKVETEENKSKVERLIEYHNYRIKAGAIYDESFNRLVRDMKALGNIDPNEEFI